MMLAIHIIGWFVFGFVVAAILLYGPTITKAYRIKSQAISMMNEATKKLRESMAKEKDFAEIAREKYELNDKYIALANDFTELGNKLLEERKQFGEFLQRHEELVKAHKALLWRAGGGVEGTA